MREVCQSNVQIWYTPIAHLQDQGQLLYMYHHILHPEKRINDENCIKLYKRTTMSVDIYNLAQPNRSITMYIPSLFTNENIPNLKVRTNLPRTSMVCYHLITEASTAFPYRHLISNRFVEIHEIVICLAEKRLDRGEYTILCFSFSKSINS